MTTRTLGPKHTEVPDRLHALAQMYLDDERPIDALPHAHQALTLGVEVLGERSPLVAQYAGTLGRTYAAASDRERAREHLEYAVLRFDELDGIQQDEPQTRFALAEVLGFGPGPDGELATRHAITAQQQLVQITGASPPEQRRHRQLQEAIAAWLITNAAD